MFLKFKKTASESDIRDTIIPLFRVVVLQERERNVSTCQRYVQRHCFHPLKLKKKFSFEWIEKRFGQVKCKIAQLCFE